MNSSTVNFINSQRCDVIILGAGGAGLMSALVAASHGLRVLLVEKSDQVGGTTAISGGQIWVPGNEQMKAAGLEDDPEDVMRYLRRIAAGSVDETFLRAFADHAPQAMAFLEQYSGLKLFSVNRPDYHPEWDGARDGRSLEPSPYPYTTDRDVVKLRTSRYRAPLTSVESRLPDTQSLVCERQAQGVYTQGAALIAALIEGCLKAGVIIQTGVSLVRLEANTEGVAGVELRSERTGQQQNVHCKNVILSTGGFEWSKNLTNAFFGPVPQKPISPPWNNGSGLLAAIQIGAGMANMHESWWTAAVTIPDELEDGAQASRNIVRELALPGSLLVNRQGRRFVNEASSYNDLGKAFLHFDTKSCTYPNAESWLIFDSSFKRNYNVLTSKKGDVAPDWFVQSRTLEGLAQRLGIDATTLGKTILEFNHYADQGIDPKFDRGASRHDQFYGDAAHLPNACLAAVKTGPYFAIPISLGNLGTKGGLTTTVLGAVTRLDGSELSGLYACGNVAASWMGLGYGGAGGSLGPILTAAYLCGLAVVEAVNARASSGDK
ncbi:FAD-dependent oxidoreductase [Pseudomonas azerbaijanoccidentalis]|jgi:succinate dehydrogenase/fumarate reductase flavoprotein subunit